MLEASSPRETLSQIISGVWGWSGPLPEALQKWGEEFVTDGAGKAKSLLYSIDSKTHFSPLRLRCFIIDNVSQFNQHFPRRTRLGFRPRSLQTLKRSLPGPGPRLALQLPWGGRGLTWAPKHHPTPQTHHRLTGRRSLPQWLEVADVKARTVFLSRTPESRRETRSEAPSRRHRHQLSSRACAPSIAAWLRALVLARCCPPSHQTPWWGALSSQPQPPG